MEIEQYKLEEMVKGWFIGNFSPTLFSTNGIEVGVRKYNAGVYEPSHYHKVATEFTVVVNGIIEMNGKQYSEGDIIKIIPGISADFKTITETTVVVVKIPGEFNDKYIDHQSM